MDKPSCKYCKGSPSGMILMPDGYACPECILSKITDLREGLVRTFKRIRDIRDNKSGTTYQGALRNLENYIDEVLKETK